jgi:hypothetical protein
MNIRLLMLLLFILAGCETIPQVNGPAFQSLTSPGADSATLWVYRLDDRMGKCCWPRLSIANQNAVDLINGGYSKITLAPGNYDLASVYYLATHNPPEIFPYVKIKNIPLIAEAGKEYFLRFTIVTTENSKVAFAGGSAYGYKEKSVLGALWVPVSRAVALSEMPATKWVEPTQVAVFK